MMNRNALYIICHIFHKYILYMHNNSRGVDNGAAGAAAAAPIIWLVVVIQK